MGEAFEAMVQYHATSTAKHLANTANEETVPDR